jgi:vacuolar-type H+-ATPase subunit H
MANMLIKLPNVTSEVTIRSEWMEERDRLVALSSGIAGIACQDSFSAGGELLKKITKTSNVLEKMRKELTDPYTAAAKIIKSAADKAREPLEAAKDRLQSMLNDFARAQAAKAEEERRRIEEQQRAEIEKQEAMNRIAAEEFGAEETEIFAPSLPVVKPETKEARADDVRVSHVLKFEVLDASEVPTAFKVVDPSLIRIWMRERSGEITGKLKDSPEAEKGILPGVRFYLDTQVCAR